MLQLIPVRFSTCLQQWHGKEVRYTSNILICALHRIWPNWPQAGFHMPPSRKDNVKSRNFGLKSKKRRSGVLSLLGIKRWSLQWKDTRLWFVRTTQMAVFFATIAQQGIPSYAGGTKEQVLLHQSNAAIQHQIRRQLPLGRQLCHPVSFRVPKYQKPTVCSPKCGITCFLSQYSTCQSWCISQR